MTLGKSMLYELQMRRSKPFRTGSRPIRHVGIPTQAVYDKISQCSWSYMDSKYHRSGFGLKVWNIRKQLSLGASGLKRQRGNNTPPALGSAKNDTADRIIYTGHLLL